MYWTLVVFMLAGFPSVVTDLPSEKACIDEGEAALKRSSLYVEYHCIQDVK